MTKRPFTARLDAGTVEAVDAYAEAHGITRTEAAERLLSAALRATEGNQYQQSADVGAPTKAQADGERAVVEVLRASNEDLRAEVSRLWAQMAEKDRQIQDAHELADQAHRLHAAEVSRALPESKGRGFAEKVAAMFRRGER